MRPEEVPAELVEAAARALRDEQCTGHDHGTDACPDRHCRDDRTLPFYRARVRPALAAVLPLAQAAARKEALSDAADAWQTGQWADAPRRADRVQERLANAQHVTDWLRAQAAQAPQDGANGGDVGSGRGEGVSTPQRGAQAPGEGEA